MLSIDDIVTKHALSIVELVRAKARTVGHEDEIRMEATKGIDAFIADAHLSITSRHEYGLGGGRIDSKYGQVIIEYKNPNGSKRLTASNHAVGNREVIEQLQGRF